MSRRLAERLYRAQHKMAKFYQFRNRDTTLCHDVTPTQCYTLFELAETPRLTMTELARAVGLEASSMTRAVDDLVARGYVRRRDDPDDRRRCLIELTKAGRATHQRIFESCVHQERDILAQIPPSSREDVIRAMELLAECLETQSSTSATTNDKAAIDAP